MLSLRRITSSGKYIPEIDGLRFIAITSVVLYHFLGFAAPGSFAVHGYRGVNLFYLISGFILGLPFAARHLDVGPKVSLKSYFLRRLTRLEPPYILTLLICFASAPAVSLLPHLAASLLYVHTFVYGEQNPMNPVTWTLEVEVQFYCLAPLLANIFRIPSKAVRRAILLAVILLAGALQLLYWDAPLRIKLSLAFAIQFFLAGFFLIDIYLLDWRQNPQRRLHWDILSLVLWPAVFALDDRTIWIALPLALLAVTQFAFTGTASNRLLTHPAITAIGGMCYSIYLFHYVLIQPILQLSPWLYAPIMLLASTAFYIAVERPAMIRNWPKRLLQSAPRAILKR